MEIPNVELSGKLYLPDKTVWPADTHLTELEQAAMEFCILLGEEALNDGNPPVGAMLIDNNTKRNWGACTTDKSSPDLFGHAEIQAYFDAASSPTGKVGDRLEDFTLISSAEPCYSCTGLYTQGKIGRIIFAAPRWAIRNVSGIMRERDINMHELLATADSTTHVIGGYMAERSLGNFALYGERLEQGSIKV